MCVLICGNAFRQTEVQNIAQPIRACTEHPVQVPKGNDVNYLDKNLLEELINHVPRGEVLADPQTRFLQSSLTESCGVPRND